MNTHFHKSRIRNGIWGCCLAVQAAFAQPAGNLRTESTGTATFEATTNVPGITVHGKSEAVRATMDLQRSPGGLLIENIEAWMSVGSLTTGMALRDEHMRKLVFTRPDGQTPDIRFSGRQAKCPVSPGREAQCRISGTLSIRGVERPFEVPLKVKQEGDASPVLKASGDTVVKLSDFGIERPSQLGVKTENDVKLHLVFTARPGAMIASSGNGGRQ